MGASRGSIDAYASNGVAPPERIGELPGYHGETYSYWEATSGIANEVGVMIAESTCSAIFVADPRGKTGGKALLGYMELSRIALERCGTARAAVELMGSLSVEHGFFGCSTAHTGGVES